MCMCSMAGLARWLPAAELLGNPAGVEIQPQAGHLYHSLKGLQHAAGLELQHAAKLLGHRLVSHWVIDPDPSALDGGQTKILSHSQLHAGSAAQYHQHQNH